jgi:hypothetical protein
MTKAKEALGVIKKLDYMANGDFLWSDLDKIVLNYDDVKTIHKALDSLDKVEGGGVDIEEIKFKPKEMYVGLILQPEEKRFNKFLDKISEKYILIERE